MGTRAWVVAAVAFAAMAAHADPKADVTSKSKEAMENYDLMDYDAAKKGLNQALALAKKSRLDKDPVTARVYLDLGLAAFAAGDAEGAKVAFVSAVQIDPKIQIEAAYKSPELTKLLDDARKGGKGGGKAPPPPPDDLTTGGGTGGGEPSLDDAVDCSTVKGLQHTIIDSAPAAAPQKIEALVGSDITPVKVSVFYRAEHASDFIEVKLTKQGECKYTAEIPASAMKGEIIHYYVAALDGNNKAIAAKGSSGSPNILELTAPAKKVVGVKDDGEDPINGTKKTAPTPDGGDVSNGVIAGRKQPKVMITAAVGTGFGYVTGSTEGGNMVQQCCVGSSLAVITPELAYQANPKLQVGIAVRIGLPIGANVNAEDADGHSTIAPGVLVRVHYALAASGEGLRVMGQIGGGVMRNTIKLTTDTPGMDTDIVAQGPLLIGGGLGYLKYLGGKVAFVADLSALAGLAVTDKLGNTKVNSGIGADVSLGLAIGF